MAYPTDVFINNPASGLGVGALAAATITAPATAGGSLAIAGVTLAYGAAVQLTTVAVCK